MSMCKTLQTISLQTFYNKHKVKTKIKILDLEHENLKPEY